MTLPTQHRAPGILAVQETPLWKSLDEAMDAIMRPAWKWPDQVRHVYVITWPVSFIARIVAAAVTILLMAVVYIGGDVAQYLQAVWVGEDPSI